MKGIVGPIKFRNAQGRLLSIAGRPRVRRYPRWNPQPTETRAFYRYLGRSMALGLPASVDYEVKELICIGGTQRSVAAKGLHRRIAARELWCKVRSLAVAPVYSSDLGEAIDRFLAHHEAETVTNLEAGSP